MIGALRASLRIRRLEFMIAEVPIVLIPLLLAAPPSGPPAMAAVVSGVLAVFLLFHVGDLANCVADRDIDAMRKVGLAEAVDRLGPRNVWTQIALSALGALAASIHAAALLDRWILPPLVVAGVLAALAYSVEPLRFKRRGAAQSLCTWAILFPGPMLFAQFLVRPWPTAHATTVAVAFGALQTAIIVVNVAEDEREDRALGVRTTVVALGRVRALAAATVAAALGGIVLVAALAAPLMEAGGARPLALVPLAVLAAAAIAWLDGMRRHARSADDDASLARVQRAARLVPAWLTLIAWATCGAAAAVAWPR